MRFEEVTVKHFYRWYQREHRGIRSYTWVTKTIQGKGLVPKASRRELTGGGAKLFLKINGA